MYLIRRCGIGVHCLLVINTFYLKIYDYLAERFINLVFLLAGEVKSSLFGLQISYRKPDIGSISNWFRKTNVIILTV